MSRGKRTQGEKETQDMTINFDKVIERRNTNCSKYDGMAASFGRNNLLPLWIADMDFPVPEAVTEAIKRRAEHPIYGYNIFPQGYYEAFCSMGKKKRHNWDVDPAWALAYAGRSDSAFHSNSDLHQRGRRRSHSATGILPVPQHH